MFHFSGTRVLRIVMLGVPLNSLPMSWYPTRNQALLAGEVPVWRVLNFLITRRTVVLGN
jgi:hypothetical protein